MKMIKARVSTNASGKEVLDFMFEDPISVPLTEEDGVAQLKLVFRSLLTQLASGEDVTVRFENNEEYGSNLFSQACEAYVSGLDAELAQVKEDMAREGLIGISLAENEG